MNPQSLYMENAHPEAPNTSFLKNVLHPVQWYYVLLVRMGLVFHWERIHWEEGEVGA